MPLYPENTNVKQEAQTDAAKWRNVLLDPVLYAPGSLAAAVVNRFVTSVAMQNGAYTLASLVMPEPLVARKLNVTITPTSTNDTMGTLTIVGTNMNDEPITEEFTPLAASAKVTANAFKTLVSITGAGWAAVAGADLIQIGTSEVIGLPSKLWDTAQIVAASLNGVREATFPTVLTSQSALAQNTIKLNSALNASPVRVYYNDFLL